MSSQPVTARKISLPIIGTEELNQRASSKPKMDLIRYSGNISDVLKEHDDISALRPVNPLSSDELKYPLLSINVEPKEDYFSGIVSYPNGYEDKIDHYISTVPGIQVDTQGYFPAQNAQGSIIPVKDRELGQYSIKTAVRTKGTKGQDIVQRGSLQLFTTDTVKAKRFHDFLFNELQKQERKSIGALMVTLGTKYKGVSSSNGGPLYL